MYALNPYRDYSLVKNCDDQPISIPSGMQPILCIAVTFLTECRGGDGGHIFYQAVIPDGINRITQKMQ